MIIPGKVSVQVSVQGHAAEDHHETNPVGE